MKILSIDGGGIRGIIPAMILAEIEERTGDRISNLFDLIAGTSTGGLIALILNIDDGDGKPKYTAQDVVELYKTKGDKIFDRSFLQSVVPWHNLFEEKYQNEEFIKMAADYFGNQTLRNTLTEVIVPSYETERRVPWFFKSKNAKDPDRKGYNFKLRDVVLATAAAPTYFEPYKVDYEDGYLSFIDGGVYANNPALCAYIDAKSMFGKRDEDITLISLGTGQLTERFYYKDLKDMGLIGWARPILSCVFDGVNDTVDYQLSKLLNEKKYYRLQGELTKSNDDMDNISEPNVRELQLTAEEIIHKNDKSIDRIVKILCE